MNKASKVVNESKRSKTKVKVKKESDELRKVRKTQKQSNDEIIKENSEVDSAKDSNDELNAQKSDQMNPKKIRGASLVAKVEKEPLMKGLEPDWDELDESASHRLRDIDPLLNLSVECLPPLLYDLDENKVKDGSELSGTRGIWETSAGDEGFQHQSENFVKIADKYADTLEEHLNRLKASLKFKSGVNSEIEEHSSNIEKTSDEKLTTKKTRIITNKQRNAISYFKNAQLRNPEIDLHHWLKHFCDFASEFNEMELDQILKEKTITVPEHTKLKEIHTKKKLVCDQFAYWNIREKLKLIAWSVKNYLGYLLDYDSCADHGNILWIENNIEILEKLDSLDSKVDLSLVKSLAQILKTINSLFNEMDQRITFGMLYCARNNVKPMEIQLKDQLISTPEFEPTEMGNMFYYDFPEYPNDVTLEPDLDNIKNEDMVLIRDIEPKCSVRLGLAPVDNFKKSEIHVSRLMNPQFPDAKRLLYDDAERVSSVYEIDGNGKRFQALTIVIACEAQGVLHGELQNNDKRKKKIFLRVLRDCPKFEGHKQVPTTVGIESKDEMSNDRQHEAAPRSANADPSVELGVEEQTLDGVDLPLAYSSHSAPPISELDLRVDSDGERDSYVEWNLCAREDIPTILAQFSGDIACNRPNVVYFTTTVKFVISRFQCALISHTPLELMQVKQVEEITGSSLVATNCIQAATEDEYVKLTIPDYGDSVASSVTKIRAETHDWIPSGRLSILKGDVDMGAARRMGITYNEFDFDLVMQLELDWDLLDSSGNRETVYIRLRNLVADEQAVSGFKALKGGLLPISVLDKLKNTSSFTLPYLAGQTMGVNLSDVPEYLYGMQNDWSHAKSHAENMQIPRVKSLEDYRFIIYALQSDIPKEQTMPDERFPRLSWVDITAKCNLKISDKTVEFETDQYYKTFLLFRSIPKISKYSRLNYKSKFYHDERFNGLCGNIFYHMRMSRPYVVVLNQLEEENRFFLSIFPSFLHPYVTGMLKDKPLAQIGEAIEFIAPISAAMKVNLSGGFRFIAANTKVEDDGRSIKFDINYQFMSWIYMSVEVARMRQNDDRSRPGIICVYIEGNSLYPEDRERLLDVKKKMEDTRKKMTVIPAVAQDDEANMKSKQSFFIDNTSVSEFPGEKLIAMYEIRVNSVELRLESTAPDQKIGNKNFAEIMMQGNPLFEDELQLLDDLAFMISKTIEGKKDDPPCINAIDLCRSLKQPDGVVHFFRRSANKWTENPSNVFFEPLISEDIVKQTKLNLNRALLRFWFMTSTFMSPDSIWNDLMIAMMELGRPDAAIFIRNRLKNSNLELIESSGTSTETAVEFPENDVASSSDDDDFSDETMDNFDESMKDDFQSIYKKMHGEEVEKKRITRFQTDDEHGGPNKRTKLIKLMGMIENCRSKLC